VTQTDDATDAFVDLIDEVGISRARVRPDDPEDAGPMLQQANVFPVMVPELCTAFFTMIPTCAADLETLREGNGLLLG
jgi:hypothetical protein